MVCVRAGREGGDLVVSYLWYHRYVLYSDMGLRFIPRVVWYPCILKA